MKSTLRPGTIRRPCSSLALKRRKNLEKTDKGYRAMKKLLLGMTVCFWVGMVRLALAMDETTTNIDPAIPHNVDTRHQANPSPKYVHPPLSKKKTGTNLNQGKFYPLTQKPIPPATPVPGKNQLLDQKGNPVTLWPAGQKKNYTTLYQDKQN